MESTGELEEVKQLIREKIADGTINELKEKYNRKLRTNGLHTNVFAQKKITIESWRRNSFVMQFVPMR